MNRSTLLVRGLPIALAALLAQSVVAASGETLAETLLSHQKPTTTSSVEDATFGGGFAVDGDTTTRWASAEGSDPQWIAVDLGAVQQVCRVVLAWETAYATAFQVQTSLDAQTWVTAYATTTGPGGTQTIDFVATARYVRVYGTARTTRYGYSLYEFQVFSRFAA